MSVSQELEFKKRESFLSYPAFQISLVGVHMLGMGTMLGLGLAGVTDKALLAFCALSIFCITTSLLLVLSHRLVGPISRLMGVLTALSKGETLSRAVSFRKGDYLKEMPIVVEKIADLLKNKKEDAKKTSSDDNGQKKRAA